MAGRWLPYQPGIEARVIYNGPDSTSLLLRMQPGSVLAEHDHPGTEECIVLEGEVALGDRLMTAGTFHVAPKGVHRIPFAGAGLGQPQPFLMHAFLLLHVAAQQVLHRCREVVVVAPG